MRKKIATILIALVCVLTCAFGLVACDDKTDGECQHNFVNTTLHNRTCTEGSYYDMRCSKCGETRKGQQLQPATGHGRANATYNNDETCTTNGTQSWQCPMCHETITEEVPNTARHIFNGTRDCERCGAQKENKYLKFELNEVGDGYIVNCDNIDQSAHPEYKSANEDMRIVNIPAEHNGLPVVEIKKAVLHSTTVVYIPKSVKIIGGLNGINLQKIIIEDGSSWEKIDEKAFAGSHITELELPEGLTSLSSYALADMKYLTCLTLPSSLQTMESYCLSEDVCLNTIINNSELALAENDIKKYLGSNTPINRLLAVRESNPNRLTTAGYTAKPEDPTRKEFNVGVYFSYIHIDGENILTGIFDDGWTANAYYKIDGEIEIPLGITQVDSSALQYQKQYSLRYVKALKLPNSVKKINKVTKKKTVYSENSYTAMWQKISLSEYTDVADFEDGDFSRYNQENILTTRKDENSAFYTLEFNFAELWNTVKANGYTYREGGITITFSTSGGDMTNVGEISNASNDEPATVGFNIANLVITISIDDEDVRTATAISLIGHNSSGRPGYGVKVNGFYYDDETEDFVRGHSEKTFNTTNFAYSAVEFDSAKSFGKGDWKFELSDIGVYGFKLQSLKITLETMFNEDLTVKA